MSSHGVHTNLLCNVCIVEMFSRPDFIVKNLDKRFFSISLSLIGAIGASLHLTFQHFSALSEPETAPPSNVLRPALVYVRGLYMALLSFCGSMMTAAVHPAAYQNPHMLQKPALVYGF